MTQSGVAFCLTVMPQTRETQIHHDAPASYFAAIAHEPGAVWLDSSYRFGDRGRYSYVCRRPGMEVKVDSSGTVINACGAGPLSLPGADGLDFLQSLWKEMDTISVGYITYEGSLPFVAPGLAPAGSGAPAMHFLFYESYLQFDHLTGEMTAIGPDPDYPIVSPDGGSAPGPGRRAWSEPPVALTPRDDYLDAVATIKRHIHEGDIYQANFTTRFDVESQDAPV